MLSRNLSHLASIAVLECSTFGNQLVLFNDALCAMLCMFLFISRDENIKCAIHLLLWFMIGKNICIIPLTSLTIIRIVFLQILKALSLQTQKFIEFILCRGIFENIFIFVCMRMFHLICRTFIHFSFQSEKFLSIQPINQRISCEKIRLKG